MSNYATKFVAANRWLFSRKMLYITTQRSALSKNVYIYLQI